MSLPAGITSILPLTAAQRGMLFHVLEAPSSLGRYVAVLSCRIEGPLDAPRLHAAITDAVNARDAYRAGFVWQGVKQPVQAIHDVVDLPWTVLDWAGTPDVATQLDNLVELERLRQFNLKSAPLMHATLIRVAPDVHHLVWTIHHLISDGWSTGVVFEDIFQRYHNADANRTPPTQFKAYLAWLKKQGKTTDKAFWTSHLNGLESVCALDFPAPSEPSHSTHSHILRSAAPKTMRAVEHLAKSLRVTQNTVLSAIWALVLRKVMERNDVVFGQTFSGRPPQIPGVALAAGAFINTLPLRVTIDPNETARAFLQRLGQTQQEVAQHQFASLAEVQALAPTPKGTALFDTLFVNEQQAPYQTSFGDLRLMDVRTVQSSNYALAMLATPEDALGLELYFDPAKVSEADAIRCMDCYLLLLEGITAHPDSRIHDLAWHNKPDILVPTSPQYPSVIERILAQATAAPKAPAVSDDANALTYAELVQHARQMAQKLKDSGVQHGDIVPVALPRGVQTVAAFLGVMMAGATYVPIDLAYPAHRIAQIFEQVRPSHILCDKAALDVLPDHNAKAVFVHDLPAALPLARIKTSDLAYVLFTSGSQGTPKGVEITQSALAHSTAVRDTVYDETPSAYLLLSSFSFDSSVAGLYWALCTGGHLVVAPTRIEQDPTALGALISRHAVSHTLCLPSLLHALLDTIPAKDLKSLRTVIAAGEALPPSLIARVNSTLPDCRVFNEYGPTEGTVWCTAYDATDHKDTANMPIGRALPGVWVGVCDADGVPVPPHTTGEIAIAGPILARGYLNNPGRTNSAFPAVGPARTRIYLTGDLGRMDETGLISFLGRSDAQIKIRGHRVELAEVETIAQNAAAGQDVAVTHAQNSICLFIQGDPSSVTEQNVRTALSASLPDVFQPSHVSFLGAFPRLPNGKVDRKALAQISQDDDVERPSDAPPATELETQLAEIFADVIGIPVASRDAHFFELGGDSLMTIAAYSRARDQGLPISPTDIFDHPTVQGLASHILNHDPAEAAQHAGADPYFTNQDGTGAAVFLVHGTSQLYYQMARGLGPDHPVGLSYSHYFHGVHVPLNITIEDLAQDALATLRQLRPNGPYVLCAYSAAVPIVMELAHLIGDDEEVDVFLLDPPYLVLGRDPDKRQSPAARKEHQSTRRKLRLRILRHALRVPVLAAARLLAPQSDRFRKLWVRSAYVFALSRYRMRPYDKPVQIYVTDGNPSLTPGAVTDTYLTDKHVETLPMPHQDVVSSPEGIVAVTQRVASFLNAKKKS